MTNKEKLKELADKAVQVYADLLNAEIECLSDGKNDLAVKSLEAYHHRYAHVSREFSLLRESVRSKKNIEGPFHEI